MQFYPFATIVFDAANGVLTLAGNDRDNTVRYTIGTNGAIELEIDGSRYSSDRTSPFFTAALEGVTSTTLHRIEFEGGEGIDTLILDDRILSNSFTVRGDEVVEVAGEIAADTVDITADAISVDGTISAREIGLHGFETTDVTGMLTAANGNFGGRIEVLGDRISLVGATVDASGLDGGGTVLIGGDYRGLGTVPTAQFTVVDDGSRISADALSNGDGGRVIVWADDTTEFQGNLSAQGGTLSGDGGFAEISGKHLAFGGQVNVLAVNGTTGTVLFDPIDIVIADADGTDGASGGDVLLADAPAAEPWNVTPAQLDGVGANVTLQASNDISVTDAIALSAAGASFTLEAGNEIHLDANITTNNGNHVYDGAVVLGADATVDAGSGDVSFNSTIDGGQSLTVNSSGTTTFSGKVGDTTTRLVNLTTDAPGTTVLSATGSSNGAGRRSISLTGNATFNDAVTVTRNTSIVAGRNITFNSTLDGTTGLILQVGGGRTLTFGENVGSLTPIGVIQIAGHTLIGGDSITSNLLQRYINNVTIDSPSNTVTLTATTGPVWLQGSRIRSATDGKDSLVVNAGGAIEFDSATDSNQRLNNLTLNSDTDNSGGEVINIGSRAITTTGTQTYEDAIVLEQNTTFTGGGNITFNSTVAGNTSARNLTVDAGTATIDFNGAVGGGNLINNIDLSSGSLTVDAAMTAQGNITLATDAIALNGVVTGTGELEIAPQTTSTSIGIGTGATGTLNLDATELGNFANGFSRIVIGNTSTGNIDIANASFTDPISLIGANIGDSSSGTDLTGDVTFEGNVQPGGSGTTDIDEFVVSGDVSFASSAALTVQLNGTTAGTQYDRLQVAGGVNLNSDSGTGATLSVNLGSFVPTVGDTFTLIDNDGTDGISGTFNSLAEGGAIELSGNFFQISYVGGDGNDVVLTAIDAPEVSSINTVGSSPTNADSVTFDVTFSESVSNVDPADFALATTGTASGTIANVTGSGSSYTVTVNGVAGDGTLGLNLVDDDSITNNSSIALGGSGTSGSGDGSFTGQTYTIENISPAASSVTPNLTLIGDSNVGTGTFTLTVVFDEDMDTATNPVISFPTSGEDPSNTLTLASGSWTNATTFVATYNVADAEEQIAAVDVTVSNARDVAGNIQTAFTETDVFEIDTDLVVTNTNDSGIGSLRQAILNANATAGTGTITFNIPGDGPHTITLASALPNITDTVTIDGYSQTGASENTLEVGNDAVLKIVLDGSATGSGNGLTLAGSSDGSTIQGLVVQQFSDYGIQVNRSNVRIRGNFIGTDATGNLDRGNGDTGLVVFGSDNTIGGTTVGDRNVISGNESDGLYLGGGGSHQVKGNYIGTNAAGDAQIRNNRDGIEINSRNNIVGGTTIAERNVISGNNAVGIYNPGGGGSNTIQGNYLGLNAAGDAAIDRQTNGIQVRTPNNIIGGSGAGEGNVISGNGIGVGILKTGAVGNQVRGNLIGTDSTGTNAIANTTGVSIWQGATDSAIGGTNAGEGNVIANSSGNGIAIFDDSTGHTILGNQIFDNGGLGIDLGNDGATANDDRDGDTGDNNLQNAPEITSITANTITGSLNSTPNETFQVDFYANRTGTDQGESYLGSTTVATDGNGDASFSWSFTPDGSKPIITATATNTTTGDTSEFSFADITDPALVGITRLAPTTNPTNADSLTFRVSVTEELHNLDATDFTVTGTTAAISNISVSQVNSFSYQYFRFTPTDLRGSRPLVQLAEFDFWLNNTELTPTSVSNPDGSNPSAETPDKAIDNNINTKWLDRNTGPLVFDFGTVTEINGYSFTTANDVNDRDPISWTLEGSNDGSTWNPIDFQTNFDTTTSRRTSISTIPTSLVFYDLTVSGGDLADLDGTVGIDLAAGQDLTDLFGNALPDDEPSPDETYTLDNTAPTVLSVTPNLTLIGDSNVGTGTFTLTAIFDEDMDTATNPVLSFPTSGEDPSNTLTLASQTWTDSTTFVATYDVADAEEQIAAIDVTVSNARDVVGNIQTSFTETDVFEIDTDLVVTNTNDSGVGSLRQAILNANATAGTGTITFDIPGDGPHTITLASALPAITETVILDGYSQTGASENSLAVGNDAVLKIVLNGSGAGDGVSGLTLADGSDGSTIQGLVIQQFSDKGIAIASGSDGNIIRGNFIGTDVTGNTDLGNTGMGLNVVSENNLIGGSNPGSRNVISGNDQFGIGIDGNSNTIENNYIGTNAAGDTAIGNNWVGVDIETASNILRGNVISGNKGARGGVAIRTASGTNNQVLGNFLGTDATGTVAVGNTNHGLTIEAAPNNTIGGSDISDRNIISGNGSIGILLNGSNGTIVRGNFVGTDVTGTLDVGNGEHGIFLSNASNNLIGGTGAGDRNIISGNGINGISIFESRSTNNQVLGNYVGTQIDGVSPLGNTRSGIALANFATNNQIGGSGLGEGNITGHNGRDGISVFSGSQALIQGNQVFSNSEEGIAFRGTNHQVLDNTVYGNAGIGISVESGGTSGAQVLRNEVYDNGGLGIDINKNGVSANDENDTDTGTNNIQNFPVLNFAELVGGELVVNGSINSTANTTFRLEFFLNDTLDDTGYGEGKTYLDFEEITIDGSSNADFTLNLGTVASLGQFVTATATNTTTNETSEFSLGVEVASPIVSLETTTLSLAEGTGTDTEFSFTVTLSQPSSKTITVTYETHDDTAIAPDDYTDNDNTLTFAPGETSKTITVSVVGDDLSESPETFSLQLTGTTASGGIVGEDTAIATILDDEEVPTLSVSDVTVNEGDGTASFTVSLDAPSGNTITADYATANSGAVSPDDYTPTSGTLTFNPGDVTATINVPIINDEIVEASETFALNLSNGSNVAIADPQGIATITNDDLTNISIDDVTVAEGENGIPVFEFVVSLDKPASEDVTVVLGSGTGEAGEPDIQTVTIPAGETSQTVMVTLPEGIPVEDGATVEVNLSDARIGGTIDPDRVAIADSQGVGTLSIESPEPTIELTREPTPEETPIVSEPPDVRLVIGQLEINLPDFPTTGICDGDGNDTDDLMLAGDDADTLCGYGGNDILAGFGSIDYIDGGTENDILFGNTGNDTIDGGAGDDLIFAGKQDDLATGGAGADILVGDIGRDFLYGDLENDIIFGNTGNDTIDGGAGDDRIFAGKQDDLGTGGAGSDILVGDIGNDSLNGNEGNDVIFGNTGADVLDGDDGDDWLFGGEDNDIVLGSAGRDILSGDIGDDILVGGEGVDRFDFRIGDGNDIIADFTDGVDIIGLRDGLTFAGLTLTQVNEDTQVTAAGLVVTLQGVDVGAIDSADFAVF